MTGSDDFLTANEIKDVDTLISELIEKDLQEVDEQEYLISQIHGDYWVEVKRDGTYKKRFKKSAQLEQINRVKWVKTKSDNNEFYRVVAR